jgi:hypothetical protein
MPLLLQSPPGSSTPATYAPAALLPPVAGQAGPRATATPPEPQTGQDPHPIDAQGDLMGLGGSGSSGGGASSGSSGSNGAMPAGMETKALT